MKEYILSHWKADKPDACIDDHYEEVVAEGDTIKGLIRYARMKRLDTQEYFITHNLANGDEDRVGYLYEIK